MICAVLAACGGSDLDVQPAVVQWMEWPAEVAAAQPFAVRLMLPFPACHPWTLKERVGADQAAVTFEPYFLVEKGEPICLPEADLVPNAMLDTVSIAPGLHVSSPRSFDMRALASADGSPNRIFGQVTVLLTNPDTSRRNAGGTVTVFVDNSGCVRIRPGYFGPQGFVLEDQADTAGLMNAFVRGYFHDAAAPVCGETRVFHLESRN
jgi:hypothetical protein